MALTRHVAIWIETTSFGGPDTVITWLGNFKTRVDAVRAVVRHAFDVEYLHRHRPGDDWHYPLDEEDPDWGNLEESDDAFVEHLLPTITCWNDALDHPLVKAEEREGRDETQCRFEISEQVIGLA